MRKYFLRRDMKDLLVPPFAYLPLTGSLDPFQQILRTLPSEGYAFSTKARCPALMLFEMEVHPRALDIGTFLCCELERYEENQVINRNVEIKNGSSSTWQEEDANISEHEKPEEVVRLTSVLGQQQSGAEVWKPEGTGMGRLEAMGLKFNPATFRPSLSGNSSAEAKADALAAVNGSAMPQAMLPADANRSRTGSNTSSNNGQSSELATEDVTVDMPPTIIGETFTQKAARLRAVSPYGHLPGWKLGGMIAKSNDDVRQEVRCLPC